MLKNIGWLYNKQYFEKLDEYSEYHKELARYNEEILKLNYYEYNKKIEFLKEIFVNDFKGFSLTTCYPGLITGVGVSHQTTLRPEKEQNIDIPEFKLGFHFDHTTGIPSIPGASVKGVLRDAFPMKSHSDIRRYNYKVGYIAYILHGIKKIEEEVEIALKKEKENAIKDKIGQEKYDSMINLIRQNEGIIKENMINELYNSIGEIDDEEFKIRENTISEKVQNEIQEQIDKAIVSYFDENSKKKREYKTIINNCKDAWDEKIDKKIDELVERIGVDHFPDVNEFYKYIEQIEEEIFDGKNNDKYLSIYKRDIFFDAILMRGNKKNLFLGSDYLSPHENRFKEPKPIQFLKLLPNVSIKFFFELKDGIITKEEKMLLFKVILLDKGIGAKTNVGYGQFKM